MHAQEEAFAKTPPGVVNDTAPTAATAPPQPEMKPDCAESPDGDQVQPWPQSKPSLSAAAKPAEHDDDLTSKILIFLSTATPETLGAVVVGLSAVTYLVLGRLGLVLIGALGGIALLIHYEQRVPAVSRAVRGESGIDAVERLIREMKEGAAAKAGREQDEAESEELLLRTFDDFGPQTRDAMKGLVDAIIRDYVKWWYSPVVPADRSFPLACRKVLTSFLLSISNHLSRKSPADSFLDFLTNSSSMVIVLLSELSAAFAELPPESDAVDAVYSYLAANSDSRLANLLNRPQQASKFRMVAEDLLAFLEKSSYNCEPARVFLREIIANVILEMTLQSCSQPEWINGWIVYLLEAGEPDFSQAIDVGMQSERESNAVALTELDGKMGDGKPSRPSLEADRGRKRDSTMHKKKLSKADEEMEEAMEEMKRMNQMIAEETARRAQQVQDVDADASEASQRLAHAVERTSQDLALGEAESLELHAAAKASPKDAASTDGQSSKADPIHTPVTPRSSDSQTGSPQPSPNISTGSHFTNFDQLGLPGRDTDEGHEPLPKAPLTLHKATITIHDEPENDKARIRSKPGWDLLIQIEPSSSHYPGWMIVRKYADFETLHEVLRRIATISGATAFTQQHNVLPAWKVHTRASLRAELEGYLRDACCYQVLAESEGMKRFLDKDQGLPQGPEKSAFGFDTFGKNMLDVLATAPKGAMQGGKAMVGGMNSVLGNIGLGQKKTSHGPLQDQTHVSRLSISTPPPRMNSMPSPATSQKTRDSMDSQRSSVISTQPGKVAPMERRASYQPVGDGEGDGVRRSQSEKRDNRPSGSGRPSREHSRASSLAPVRSPSSTSLDGMRLPPPPEAMTDDYEPPTMHHHTRSKTNDSFLSPQNSFGPSAGLSSPTRSLSASNLKKPRPTRQFPPLSEADTRVAVELMFATINELYTLSSAWNIRRTLLAAAKSFLLRPGNPSLASIQTLMQESVLDANTSDAGLAAHLRKLRENTLPTEEERAAWPAEMTTEEKEKLRVKARALLIKSGVPAALMGVMGQNATTEALGRLFDCLQIEEVARGLIFGVMLQAVGIITH